MANEPDNHRMDDLLKAYAKKRREQAGAPLELHPATRRLLQSEAAKPGKRTDAEREPWWAGWLTLPRVSFAVSVLCVLMISAFVVLKSKEPISAVSDAERKLPEVAKARLEENRPATPEPVAKPSELPALKELAPADRISQADTAGAVDGKNLRELAGKSSVSGELMARNGAVVAESARKALPAPAAAPGASSAPVTVAAPQNPAPGSEVAGRAGRGYEAPKKAEAGIPSERAGGGNRQLAASQMTFMRQQNMTNQRFSRATQLREQRAGSKPQPLDNVLANFQVEQVGNEVRIIDSDGSTYSGQIAAAGPAAVSADDYRLKDAQTKTAAMSSKAAPSRPAQSTARLMPAETQPAQVQNYSFRATGTNRSLNQLVVFDANLVAQTNVAQAGVQQRGGAQPAPSQQIFLSNSRIEGRARVANQEIQIEAVTVGP